MQSFLNPWLIALALCSLIALGLYAAFLWRRVWRTEQQRKQHFAEQKRQRHQDLTILTQSFLSGEMPWAEGCIRIKVILDHYDTEMALHPDNQVLQSVFSATEHIPSHDAWRALSSAEKKPFSQLLSTLEQEHKAASVKAVEKLRKHLNN